MIASRFLEGILYYLMENLKGTLGRNLLLLISEVMPNWVELEKFSKPDPAMTQMLVRQFYSCVGRASMKIKFAT